MRRRLARNPNERMRTKPRGRTWSKKRRKNSCEPSVMTRCILAAATLTSLFFAQRQERFDPTRPTCGQITG